jgi:hypothetical protein
LAKVHAIDSHAAVQIDMITDQAGPLKGAPADQVVKVRLQDFILLEFVFSIT